MPHLAASLEAIASGGPDVVYMGELAERTTEYSSTLGDWLTHDDLREHRGEWTDPISTRYRHIELLECPPNGQVIAALVAGAILDGFATVGADDGGEAALACLDPYRIANVRSGIDPARAVVPVPFVPLGAPRDTAYVAVVDEHGNGIDDQQFVPRFRLRARRSGDRRDPSQPRLAVLDESRPSLRSPWGSAAVPYDHPRDGAA